MAAGKKIVILLGDNDVSRAYHALVIAISAKSLGRDVVLFATGLGVLIFSERPKTRLIGLPWLASAYIKWKLRKVGARRIEDLVEEALRLGVTVYVDEPVARMLDARPRSGVKYGGALSFLAEAEGASLVLTL